MNHLQTASFLANLLDNKFRLGIFGFGLDPLLDLLPIGGSVISLALSLYILWVAHHHGAPMSLRQRMLFNVVIDFGLGLIPGIGFIADLLYQANLKNLALLREWLANRPLDGEIVAERPLNYAQAS